MNEQILDTNKDIIQNPILPNINLNQVIPQFDEKTIQKEETNSSKILKLSLETDRPNSDNLNETDSFNIKNEKNSKIDSITKLDETKSINPTNITENINIINNNKLYVTESNILSNPNKITTDKSRNSKINTIETIPENPIKDNLKSNSFIYNKTPNNKQNKLIFNNLSPDIDYKRKIVNKYNFAPFKLKIKTIEEQMIKQNEYDFQKAMKDLQIQYKQKIKLKQREKLIHKKNEKFQNKLKQMEEFRNNLINEKLLKLKKKQNSSKKRRNRKNIDLSSSEKTDRNNKIKKNQSTLNINYSERENNLLPSIQNMSKLEYIKLQKKINEDEFCNQSLQKLQESEEIHKRNHHNFLDSINKKIKKQVRLYRQRSYNCLRKVRMKDDEYKENIISKQMIKSYSINKLIRKAKNDRKSKISKSLSKKYNIKENKEILEQKYEQKILDYQKKLKKEINFTDKKILNLNKCITEKKNKKIIFSNLHKQNLRDINNEMNNYYHDLILRQEDNVMIINDILKEEVDARKIIVKRTIDEQIQKSKEFENLIKFRNKMKNENINNFRTDKVKKIFEQKRIEEKKKKEEEKWLAKFEKI